MRTARQAARGDAVPRRTPDAGSRPWGREGLGHHRRSRARAGWNPGHREGLGALDTPEGFQATPEEIAPLTLEGFSPQNTILAGAVIGWIMAGRRGTKGQGVRLMDVFVLGPLMAQAGLWESRSKPWAQALMRAAAGATVTYNLRNYLTTAGRR